MFKLSAFTQKCTGVGGLRVPHLIAALLLATSGFGQSLFAADQPNVLIVLADDCTHSDLAVYGGVNAKTPNIDAFARQGLVFNRAYLASAMCQPCRAELYTGQYPMRNGCAWNHSASRPTARSLPHYLGDIGYRVGIAGKVHVLPTSAFPFEMVDGFDPNCVRNPTQAHQLDDVLEFMSRDASEPFCLVVALVEPHVPWVMGDASQYKPAAIQLPDNLADTKQTRRDFASYLAEITYMDSQFGQILDALESSGRGNDTLVMFSSEQGAQFPGNKWTNWDTGVHTALIARWPGIVAAGQRTDAIVQYADVAPTVLDACRPADDNPGESSDSLWEFDGTSFLGVLKGEKAEHRKYAYGMHNNIPEGPAYPIRSITDGEFHYIRNLTPNAIYIEKHVMGAKGLEPAKNAYWPTWIWDSSNDEAVRNLVTRYMHRPADELYRLSSDPYEMNNLAEQPEYASIKQELSAALDRWMGAQGDPGIEQDTPASHSAAKQGEHRFFPSE